MFIFFGAGVSPRGAFSPFVGWSAQHAEQAEVILTTLVSLLGVGVSALSLFSAAKAANDAAAYAQRVKEHSNIAWDVPKQPKNPGENAQHSTALTIDTVQAAADPPAIPATLPTGTEAAAVQPVGSGYRFFVVLLSIICVGLLAWLGFAAYLNRREIAAHPEQVERTILCVLFMLVGIFADVILGFSDSGRELKSIKSSEVLAPLMVSVVVFFGLWGSVLSTGNTFSAAYTSLMSGLTWRRLVARVQKQTNDDAKEGTN